MHHSLVDPGREYVSRGLRRDGNRSFMRLYTLIAFSLDSNKTTPQDGGRVSRSTGEEPPAASTPITASARSSGTSGTSSSTTLLSFLSFSNPRVRIHGPSASANLFR